MECSIGLAMLLSFDVYGRIGGIMAMQCYESDSRTRGFEIHCMDRHIIENL